ncbi:hypothetical protein KGV31_002149 [Vibrio parahaemolyticus]|nr:hypothetical protein [Vibrio parahaemolyticus]EHU0344292.1 hypothetical protein [Vibrio parahaemolyticus]EHU0354326.1 hypothetical protein [Vibrio parahaemolyticus]
MLDLQYYKDRVNQCQKVMVVGTILSTLLGMLIARIGGSEESTYLTPIAFALYYYVICYKPAKDDLEKEKGTQ